MLAAVRRGALLFCLLAFIGLGGANAAAADTPTGNLLVILQQPQGGQPPADQAAVQAQVLALGGRPAGRSVPQIGLITVRPPGYVSTGAFAVTLRAIPGVASVQPEMRYTPRAIPDDPALHIDAPGTSVPWQWYLIREHFSHAWSVSRGDRALVGVIDTGIDATHPDFAGKLDATVDQQARTDSTGPAGTDQVGHGTHVASLACAT